MAKLSSMRFKDYVWPHNPRVYEIEYRKDVTSHRVPFGTYTLQNMGRQHRVLRGKGEFAGAGAYDEFKKLASVFYDMTPGVLVHPLWDTAQAYFVALRLTQEPMQNYVAYSFEFWEYGGGYPSSITPVPRQEETVEETAQTADEGEYYTAAYGDRLWTISNIYSVNMASLLEMNPQIRNPNEIGAGDVIRVG